MVILSQIPWDSLIQTEKNPMIIDKWIFLASVTLLLSLNIKLARVELKHPRGHLNYTLIIYSELYWIFSFSGDKKCRQKNKDVKFWAGIYIAFLDFSSNLQLPKWNKWLGSLNFRWCYVFKSNTCNFLEVESEVSDLTVVVYIMYI